MAVFVASGNDGHDNGVSAPVCTAEAISVGGVCDAVPGQVGWCGNRVCGQALCTDSAASDVFVCHSNSDEILDLLAPDFQTTTTDVGGSTLQGFGGTSSASPYAAAQAARLLQAGPGLAPEQLRSLMKSHSPLVSNPDNGVAFRRTDVSSALAEVLCGNGSLDAGEECDATVSGECCAADCTFLPAGTTCTDGSFCTAVDVCDGAGLCAGMAVTCDDGNECTNDGCGALIGCVFANNRTPARTAMRAHPATSARVGRASREPHSRAMTETTARTILVTH